MACIREAYENKYGRSLAKTIGKKFHGKMEDGLLSLLFDPIENFARGLKAAFHGLGTDKVRTDSDVAKVGYLSSATYLAHLHRRTQRG